MALHEPRPPGLTYRQEHSHDFHDDGSGPGIHDVGPQLLGRLEHLFKFPRIFCFNVCSYLPDFRYARLSQSLPRINLLEQAGDFAFQIRNTLPDAF